MKLSTKARYAVTAMFDLAHNSKDGSPVSISQISARQGITIDYLEQILNKLRRAELVESVRGPAGGYLLAKKPQKIKIGDIVRATEGPIALVDCITDKSLCGKSGCCSTRGLWNKLSRKVSDLLDSTTLKDICEEL
ncbi:MAG: Rrf2 family transcriptional regulator [Candidatus Margulisbacteria bacterium]|nr:Rrf2 family transcriptional regulator [Candidatus Margulisiibacteriota bacterium]MBU1022317.1 Rrf2 family transcriptional regulator [Candidatus Margulisiibacteriota bacterium]MBU1729930.1 Rrf2 family transcriptional regulator [Candidatus Margulisiibacteriota bacterium]MBU1955963.1 Rrf2 family transcriptional regulator [Candidatus Margulisiibacteriota bacterium]